MSQKRIRLTAITISLLTGILIFAMKLYAATVSNSSAIRSDALEGAVNILAAAFGLISILYSEKPADDDHPYGHGKIEYFAAVFEGGLITLAGFIILIDTGSRILMQQEVQDLPTGLIVSMVAGAVNGLLGLGILITGKNTESTTLKADGMHLLSDFWSTVGLALGLGLALLTGWLWLDPVIAFVVGIMLLVAGFKVIRPSWDALLDTRNPESIETIVNQLNQFERGPVITIHELKAQEFGRDTHVDLHIVMPEFFSIQEAHKNADRVVDHLKTGLGPNSMIHAHIDPCNRLYCNECSYENCPIRNGIFQKTKLFTAETVVEKGPI